MVVKNIKENSAPLVDPSHSLFRESSSSLWSKHIPNLLENIKDTSDELAYTALDLQIDYFFEQLKVIKDHLNSKYHPITKFMREFGSEFWEYYKKHLQSTTLYQANEDIKKEDINEVTRTALDCLLFIMFSVFISIIKFYNLKIWSNEMWRDLLLNIVASITLK